MENKPCPHCGSEKTKKNGHTHYGKQNYRCNLCNCQFVEGGQEWFVSDDTKELVKRLLGERISLEGIIRVVGVSATWLYAYIKEKYEELSDDLNADLVFPSLEEYMDDRVEEEIERLEKKNLKLLKNIRK